MTQTVLITGASGGIGYELAKQFASHRYDLVLVARREDELVQVKLELERQHGVQVKVIPLDLVQPASIEALDAQLQKAAIAVHILVNNAGFGAYGPFADADLELQLEMIDLNVRTLTHLTRLLLPAMQQRGSGKILNVASTAAFQPGPLMAVYYATKAYVLSFTEALANELQGQGITVTALCPGPTRTGFGKRANFHHSLLFDKFGMDAPTVAKVGYDGLMANKVVVIPGVMNWLFAQSSRFFSRKMVTRMVRKLQEQR